MMKDKKFIYTIVATIALLALLGFLATLGSHAVFDAKVQVNTIPDDSTITIDNKKIPQGKQVAIGAGTHTVKVSREGFASAAQKFTVGRKEAKLLTIYLNPNSDAGIAWLSLHPFQQYQIEGVGSRGFDKTVSENNKNYPIVQQLPLYGPDYNITYGQSPSKPNNPNAIALYIQATSPFARQQALDDLRNNGVDPTDMEIVFTSPQE